MREAQPGAAADGVLVGAAAQAIPGVTYNAVGGYYGIDAGCAGVDALPNVSFAINGNVYALPPWQWTQAVRCAPTPPPADSCCPNSAQQDGRGVAWRGVAWRGVKTINSEWV